jgi:hypothetical protein
MEGATQCQQSGSTGWGCCIPIDNFFPCTGISSCELEICDVKEVALQSFRAMYLFVSAQTHLPPHAFAMPLAHS